MANVDVAFVGSIPELHTRYMGQMFFRALCRGSDEPGEGHGLRECAGYSLRHRHRNACACRCVADTVAIIRL